LGHGFLTLQPPSEYFRHAVKIIQGRGCKVRSATDLAGGGGWQPPPVQGEYLNSTFDFLDDVLIFEKILQGPERYRIGKPCKVQSATLPNPKLLITTWEMGTLHPESANI